MTIQEMKILRIIRNSILKGCKKLGIDIGNRKRAIETAIKELRIERNSFGCRKGA